MTWWNGTWVYKYIYLGPFLTGSVLTLGMEWAEMGSIADDFTQQWMILGEVDSALKIRLIFDRRVTSVLYILDALDSYYEELRSMD
jgi:hypothetical protein